MESKHSGWLPAVLAVLVLFPALVFAVVPNLFFGYESSSAEEVIHMTEQALTAGGAYLSLEDFEKTQIDAIVTGLAGEYENIDRIEVSSAMDEDDLLWLIAINSAAHQQDLNEITAEEIRSFCTARLSFGPSLDFLSGEGDLMQTVLKVEVKKIAPETLMEQLGFDDQAKTWAGALYEVLTESGAMEKYRDRFPVPPPTYEGDTSSGGSITPGGPGGGDNAIDISAFVSPGTKNNLDLAAYAIQAWENGWGYVWGTYGNVLTPSLFDYKLQQYPDGVGKYADFIRENWLNRRTADCVGLIKGYGWLDAQSQSIRYGTNGMPDCGANQMYRSAAVSGPMETMPETVGLAVWKPGHIGVYIGGGYVIEAMGTKYGVVKTELAGRGWEGWCEILYIDYLEGWPYAGAKQSIPAALPVPYHPQRNSGCLRVLQPVYQLC